VSANTLQVQSPITPSSAGRVTTAVAAKRPPKLYFVNAIVDYTVIGVASIVTFILLRSIHGPERDQVIWTTGAALLWVCNWPHFAATSYRLYHSPHNIMQYPVTALGIPWLILAAVVASIASPDLIAPCFVKILLIWSPYHFSGQTLGISLIYARRAGFKITPRERFALSAFIYGTFISQTVRSEVLPAGNDYYGIHYLGLGLPAWSIQAANIWMWVGGIAFLLFVIRWCMKNNRMLPPIVLLPAITQYVWFVHSSDQRSFQEFVPFFHSAQYLLIAWSVQLKEKMDLQGIRPSLRYVLTETGRWGGLNILIGAVIFWMVPRLMAESGMQLSFALGIVTAAIQIHHFFVDGVIWKLKNKNVASPLMVNIEDLVGSPAVQEARA
jgi:hypothetical protein